MNIQENISLLPFNTFAIDAKARWFCRIHSVNDFQNLLQDELSQQSKLILGGGSNILLSGDFNGLVIKNEIGGIDIVREDDQHIWLKVGAGENWHQFVIYCVQHNYAGIENLSLIPGTMGATPIQNIGAYGVELKDVFYDLQALNMATGKTQTFITEDCQFDYRDSVFKHELKNKYVITHVTLRLNKQPSFNLDYGTLRETLSEMGVKDLTIKAVSDAVIKIRQSKLPDPNQIPNAGSFFKNPIITNKQFQSLQSKYKDIPHFLASQNHTKIPAAWLIEKAGWKGKRFDQYGVHKKQALVLVNYGEAQGNQIAKLAQQIKQDIRQKFAIELEQEVTVV